MIDHLCHECSKTSGGCPRHNGSGIYTTDETGQLRQTHWPAVVVKDGVPIYYMEQLVTVPFQTVNGAWK